MNLHNAGHNYYGYYYYNSLQKPIYFSGEDSSAKGKIILMASPTGDATETFSFIINGSNASGNWKKDEQSKPLSFTATEAPNGIPLTYVYTQGEKKLRPQLKQSPAATFLVGSIWPTGNSALDVFAKKAILKMYDEKAPMQEIGKLTLQTKNNFFKSYESENKDLKLADLKEYPEAYNNDQTEEILMVYQSPKLFTIAQFSYAYTGGAHGNYGTSYSSYDLVNKKELKLTDVISLEGKKKLPALLER